MISQILTCSNCGCTTFERKQKGPHIGAYCLECGTWIKWLPKTSNSPKMQESDGLYERVDLYQQELKEPSPYDGDMPWEE